jgi:hypothetical protein
MSVFKKIDFAGGADEGGLYWEFSEPVPSRVKPSWCVRLTKDELWELFLTLLWEFTRMPLANPPRAEKEK